MAMTVAKVKANTFNWMAKLHPGAGCAHGFAHGWIDIHQILACKPVDGDAGALPWTRDYMYRAA